MTNLMPKTQLRNFLRSLLTDYNSSRTGNNWVYDSWPHHSSGVNTFPQVIVQQVGISGGLTSREDETWDEVLFQIDVLVHSETGVLSITQTAEALGDISNSPRLSFDYLPAGEAAGVTNIKHDGTAFGTVTSATNDSNFTAPVSLTTDKVEWCVSTGNLNFSTQDLTDHAGEAITATYVEKLYGERLGLRIANDVVKVIMNNWRLNQYLPQYAKPQRVSGPRVVEFGVPEGWHRIMIEYKFRVFNAGLEL